MKIQAKRNLANLSIYIMMITIGIIIIWFVGFIVSMTFDLSVFTERTSTFFYTLLAASFVIVGCSAFLNISLNISVIADSRSGTEVEPHKIRYRKIWSVTGIAVVAVVALLFIGDFLSRQEGKRELLTEANGVVTRYSNTIDKIPGMLKDSSQIDKIPSILKILSSQKETFNAVSIITSDFLDGQRIFLEINGYDEFKSLHHKYYDNSFFKGDEKDCAYLERVFSGKTDEPYIWTEKGDYWLFIPVTKAGQTFILYFTKVKRYGQIGS